MQSAKMCVVLSMVVALTILGPLSALAKPGYAAAYDNVDYYVRVKPNSVSAHKLQKI